MGTYHELRAPVGAPADGERGVWLADGKVKFGHWVAASSEWVEDSEISNTGFHNIPTVASQTYDEVNKLTIRFTVPAGHDIQQVELVVDTHESQGDVDTSGYPVFYLYYPNMGMGDPWTPLDSTSLSWTSTYGGYVPSAPAGCTIVMQETAACSGIFILTIRYHPLTSGDYGFCTTSQEWILEINGLNNPTTNSNDVSIGCRTASTAPYAYPSGTLETSWILLDVATE